jgi:hypothetical protein
MPDVLKVLMIRESLSNELRPPEQARHRIGNESGHRIGEEPACEQRSTCLRLN